ncbi:ribonuclease-3 [Methylohalomonas lacus]|uniref:Ribonuclease 3 n=1 Tax=Methylohalomonas lacus TaxID=398773 RepID=A0AAE3L0J2_9GAMM|nr:ribonuclease III [Methylohalomonas lacus]MCS3902619.1 ribonuclease-3 [Methylohalomonas lacus]
MNNSWQIPTSCLGHDFNDAELLKTALTHRSVGAANNERLEYLGDAILGFVIAEALYQQFPQASEGSLTRLRAALVKRETLARLGRQQELGDLIQLGSGELKSGGWRRDSILANAMEAIIGAIYMDAGIEICRQRILDLYSQLLSEVSPEKAGKDPKTMLQEYLQARHLPLPIYRIESESGEAHSREFTVECAVDGLDVIRASGRSKQMAEQAAAEQALQYLQVEKGSENT